MWVINQVLTWPKLKLPQDAEKHGLRNMPKDLTPRPITDEDPVHERVLNSVAETGNAVLAKKAANELNK